MAPDPLKDAFSSHPRRWREMRYVYPVISRRSHGLSIGINLTLNAACNFRCVYCCTDRSGPPVPASPVDLAVLETELRQLVAYRDRLFDEPEFRHVPAEFRRLNDLAFSGDGEPTAVPQFPAAARLAAEVRRDFNLAQTKIILITNACFLAEPRVAETLRFLDDHNLEIWAKLDAGTEAYFQRVNRAHCPLDRVLAGILAAARARPLVIQSLFARLHNEPPPPAEIAAYADRLRALRDQGAQIGLVQLYTVARRTAEPFVAPLTAGELEQIAAAVRATGLPLAVYP